MSQQRILIITGMHRSGTSALARACNLAGAALGSDLMLPQDDNPTGFWEHREIVELHDALLTALGSSWDDTGPLPREWCKGRVAAPYQEKLQELLLRVFEGAPLPAVKDPRICRLLPLWTQSLRAISWTPSYLLQMRNPIEVALSLRLRNGFEPQQSYLLWLRHVLDAERWTRGAQRAFLNNRQLMSDRSTLIEALWDRFDFPWPAERAPLKKEIDSFIQPGLQHHETTIDSLEEDPRLVALVGQAFQGWRHLAEGEEEKGQGIFDSLNRILEGVDYLFSEPLARGQSHTVIAEKARQAIETELNELKSQQTADLAIMGQLRQELDRLREDLRVQADQRLTQSREMGKLKSDLDTRDRKAKEFKRIMETIERQFSEAEQKLKIQDQQMNELKTNLSSSTRYSDELVQSLKNHELDAERYLAEANNQSKLIEKLEADREQLRVRIGLLENQIEMILTSTSWRLTAPLRAIKDSLTD